MTAAVAAGSRRAPGASSCSLSTLSPCWTPPRTVPAAPQDPPLRAGCPSLAPCSVYRRLLGCGMAPLESPGRAALSPWTELRDSGCPAGRGHCTPPVAGGSKSHPGDAGGRLRLEVLCLGESLGGSRGGSPEEAAQTPCHSIRGLPRSGFWQWPRSHGQHCAVARVRGRVGTPGLGGGEGCEHWKWTSRSARRGKSHFGTPKPILFTVTSVPAALPCCRRGHAQGADWSHW